MIVLQDIYEMPVNAAPTLFELLRQRPEYANISHRKMPTYDEHAKFVASKPYTGWYLIVEVDDNDDTRVTQLGAIYLSKRDEIGVGIFAPRRGRGHGSVAIRMLMARHIRPRYYANIAPSNPRSAALFRRMGFQIVQHTYEWAA